MKPAVLRSGALAILLLGASGLARAEIPVRPLVAQELRSILDAEKGRVVVLNLWATWCAPCLREIPELMELESSMSRSGVRLIGVAMDEPGADAAQVGEFRRKYFPGFVTYARRGPEIDELASVVDVAWNEVVPTTYILDRRGSVVSRLQGRKTPAEFRSAIEAALRRP